MKTLITASLIAIASLSAVTAAHAREFGERLRLDDRGSERQSDRSRSFEARSRLDDRSGSRSRSAESRGRNDDRSLDADDNGGRSNRDDRVEIGDDRQSR